MKQDRPTIVVDDAQNADWTKQSWDYPPYKSADFLASIGGLEGLPAFRKMPAYRAAVQAGLIHDDEWVGAPQPDPRPKTRDRLPRVIIHRH